MTDALTSARLDGAEPWEPLFDVLILNVATMTVSSIAARSVREKGFGFTRMSAEEVHTQVRDTLNTGFVAMTVAAGLAKRGDVIFLPALKATETSPKPRRLSVIEQRQADGICITCASPNLSTRLHCEECARKADVRSCEFRKLAGARKEQKA